MVIGQSTQIQNGDEMGGQLILKWDPKNLEIRTRSVQMALQPLVIQVTTLINTKEPSKKRKGRSKRAGVLVAAVEMATVNFIQKGQIIANENPTIKTEMTMAIDEVRKSGEEMSVAARNFADEPLIPSKREPMIQAGRKLLLAVTKLLILADMVDIHLLLRSLGIVESSLKKLETVSSHQELLAGMQDYAKNTRELMQAAAIRQRELTDPQSRDEMASARALLKKHSTMLMTSSAVYIRHPELASAKANRDFVMAQVCEAVNSISDVAQGRTGQGQGHQGAHGTGELAGALDDFDQKIIMDPIGYSETRTRPSLEEMLESIVSGSALIASSPSTRDERGDRIVAECNAVRQALQDLLSEYMANTGKKVRTNEVNRAIDHTHRKTRDLRRQLRKAVGDHVSDIFLETNEPLIALVEAAKAGDEEEVEECSQFFAEHAKKLIGVANLAASMSSNQDGVKMVRFAAGQLEILCPQIINAARTLVVRSKSRPAIKNMELFQKSWESQLQLLMDAVDDITSIDDFLAVSENHILEDVNKCVVALEEGDEHSFRTVDGIQARARRIGEVVSAEMCIYEPGIYTQRVMEAVNHFRREVMPIFAQTAQSMAKTLAENPFKSVDQNEFLDASSLVLDGVREIRLAVLMNRTDDELDPDEVEVDKQEGLAGGAQTQSGDHLVDEYPDISGISTAREAMRKLTEEDRQRIAQQVESFRTEKLQFDREVAKWDEGGNDIIALAKRMCRIMLDMTDFTRGQGPLKTSMDVINAAKNISDVGKKLDNLVAQIAKECPESSTKNDLLAYLQQITLYCHQLKITAKVKADVQNVSGQLVVSGLDSATSLIQAAKNLMTAVVHTVKASYVASTKYRGQGNVSLPVWKMKAPEKKPLVLREKLEENRAIVRRASQKKVQNPAQALSEFQTMVGGGDGGETDTV